MSDQGMVRNGKVLCVWAMYGEVWQGINLKKSFLAVLVLVVWGFVRFCRVLFGNARNCFQKSFFGGVLYGEVLTGIVGRFKVKCGEAKAWQEVN